MGGKPSKSEDKSSSKIGESSTFSGSIKKQSQVPQSKARSSTTLKMKEPFTNGLSALQSKQSEQRQPNTPLDHGNQAQALSPLRQSQSRFVSDSSLNKDHIKNKSLQKFSPSKRQNVLPQMTQRVLTSQNMILCKLPLNLNLNQSEEKSDPHGTSFLSQINISNPVLEPQSISSTQQINLSPRNINSDNTGSAKYSKTAEKTSQYFKVRESYEAMSGRKSLKINKNASNHQSSKKAMSKLNVHTYNQDQCEDDDDDVPAENKTLEITQPTTHYSQSSAISKPVVPKQMNMSTERKPPLDSKYLGVKKSNRTLTMNTSAATQILYEKRMEKKTQERDKMTKVLSVRPGKVLSPSAVDMKRKSIKGVNQSSENYQLASKNVTNESSITLKKLNSLFSRQQQKKFTTSSPKPKHKSDFNSLGFESQIKETVQQVHNSYRPQVGMWKKNQGNPVGTLQMRQTSYQEPQSQQISVLSYFHNNQQVGDSSSAHNPRLTEASMPSQHQQDEEISIGGDSQTQNDFKEMALPAAIVISILTFNMNDYPKYIRISAAWHCCIGQALDDYCNQLENKFIKSYSRHLNFLRSENNATPIYFCKQLGTRLDRILHCEITNNNKLINNTFKVGYTFQYLKNNSSNSASQQTQVPSRYAGEHRFDIIKKGQRRVTWLHISDDQPPYSQTEIQMSPGDIVEIPICIFNMNGLIDLSQFEWDDPCLLSIPNNEKDPLSYNRDLKIIQKLGDRKTKVHANTNRICEIEDAVVDWIPVGLDIRDQPRQPIPVNIYEYRFKLLSVAFNELDMHFNKIVLQTIRLGNFDSKTLGDNIIINVAKASTPITNEIRKRGVMFDRNKVKERIQLRMGDIIVIYHSKAIPLELQPKYALPESAYASQQEATSFQSQTSQPTNGDYLTNKSNSAMKNLSPKSPALK